MAYNILVIGDLILDHYISGDANRLSPEAPIPVVSITDESYILGGAGNVVRNLKTFGANVNLISVIGKDKNGDVVNDLLKNINISINGIISCSNRPTTIKSRVQVSNHQIVRIDREVVDNIKTQTENLIFKKFNNVINSKKVDVVIISDYGKGVLTVKVLNYIISTCREIGIKVLVDPKGNDFSKYKGAFLITPNKLEASIATQIKIIDDQSLLDALIKLKKIINTEQQIITLGSKGIALYYNNKLINFPALASEVFDVTGAGDTVISALAFQFASGSSIEEAIIFANKAASIVVQKHGSATASLEEINTF